MTFSKTTLQGRCALLDIEGTLADIRFVYDVMFPYVREHVRSYLESHWDSPGMRSILTNLAADASYPPDAAPWNSQATVSDQISAVVACVHSLMDRDSKTTGLKALQGVVWESGFRSGALQAEVFADVVEALKRWQQAGVDLRIYSSGSILAQRLFFGHSTEGDLTGYFRKHYDTTSGSKKDASSYLTIANDIGLPPEQIVFFTDVYAEIQAASQAGMQVVACVRPNNVPLPSDYTGLMIETFDSIEWK